jgi:hypothetical protein
MESTRNQGDGTIRLDLTPSELQLLRAALQLLEQTLGHEEADELEEVQALLERLPPVRGGA